ncbi:MAG TPA: hypothetical protein VF681_07080 [Abditibacteriaceae bacterium]|jgi:hypothetical protein
MSDIYNQLITINEATFSTGHYEASYHALMAALHYARDVKDCKALADIARLAGEQLSWIDSHAPEYRHSTRSSQLRNNENILAVLARQAEASIVILEHEASKETEL